MREYFDTNVVNACKTLFGSNIDITREFVLTMEYDDLRSAFRKKAFETHPDLHGGSDDRLQKQQSEQFMGVRSAYGVMLTYCEKRAKRSPAVGPFQTVNKFMESDDRCSAGTVPMRRLEIGGYLYYRGCIPYPALIKALSWQKSQRPAVGVIAKQWKWLNDEQIRTITSFRGQPRLFGERAIHFQLLTSFQVKTLLAFQRTQQKKIGQYFVENGLLTEQKIEQMVVEMNRHNAQLSMPMSKSA